MALFFCKTCNREFERQMVWGKVPCPTCNSGDHTIAWTVKLRQLRLNRVSNEKHPMMVFEPQLLAGPLGFLDERDLAFVALVCSRWRAAAQRLLTHFIPRMTAYGSMSHTLKNVLIAPETGLLTGVRDLQLAVDQFPFPKVKHYGSSVLNYIIENKIKIDLSLGTDDVDTREALVKAAQSVRVIEDFAKMHNKIWVIDKQGVIVGSPNVSFSGLEGRNIESFIMIRSKRVGSMFAKYLKMLKAPTTTLYNQLTDQICREMMVYNKQSHRLKIALAPIINITDFVAQELEGAVKIVVRQFLVSHKHEYDESPGLDIVDVLCGMARNNVDIEIVLDQGAYDKQKFVQIAAEDLAKAGCKVYLQQPVYVLNSKSECLMHDKLILATLHDGVRRTLMGSAGFTSNVIANKNAECFISTDLDHIFESMLIHSDKAKKTQSTQQLFLK